MFHLHFVLKGMAQLEGMKVKNCEIPDGSHLRY